MQKIAKCFMGALAVAALAGCARDWTREAAHVAVLDHWPACAYERLGSLHERDGRPDGDRNVNQTGAGSIPRYGERTDEARLHARLRLRAEALGGNAVVIRTRKNMRGSEGHGSAMVRPDEGVEVDAIAIRVGDPAACGLAQAP